MTSEREKQIGARLRVFRDALQISRSKFSVSCGFGSERIASYESGRAPLPYAVFRAISREYLISPFWLALGDAGGSPRGPRPFDDHAFIDRISPRSLFSAVYDGFISSSFSKLQAEQLNEGEKIREYLRNFKVSMLKSSKPLDENLLEEINAVRAFAQQFEKDLEFRKRVSEMTNQEIDLTETESTATTDGVKPLLPKLLERLKKASSAPGKKSELAKFLDVPLASVSRWLSGEREPGGEITLKLFHWVEQQERQK